METLFKLKENGTNAKREILAGLTTFLTMAYIIAVNPSMLGMIGNGMTPEAVFTATVISSIIATLVMAFAANLPVALAPGMGLNAFFTFQVVLKMHYSWQTALTAVFLEGLLFILLSFFNVREAIVKAIPSGLKKAVAAGIGLFIALIGLKNCGIIIADNATLVALGNIKSGGALVAVLGLVITIVLFANRVPGAILLGIFATTLIGIPLKVTMIPDKFFAMSMPSAPLFAAFDFSSVLSLKFFAVFFTFLFVDIFDTVGTLVGVTTQAGLIDKHGNIPRVKHALLADAIGTVAGAMLGTSTVTSYVESAAGVAAGGRTGLTSLSTAFFFFLALFFSPLFLIIPSAATAPALVIVGFLMLKTVTGINFENPNEGIPAFIAIVMMPFTYSITEGIVFGILAHVIINSLTGKFKNISLITWCIFVILVIRICVN